MSKVAIHELRITLPDVWDIAEEDSELLTIVRPDGVGALQVSTAIYQSGVIPEITVVQLRSMMVAFAASEDLVSPFDASEEAGPPMLVAASYRAGGNFIRAWYVSDGVNAAFATYVCEWDDRAVEVSECERIVRSIVFESAG